MYHVLYVTCECRSVSLPHFSSNNRWTITPQMSLKKLPKSNATPKGNMTDQHDRRPNQRSDPTKYHLDN
jgi:hypothetical protein